MYRKLKPDEIIKTGERLKLRIGERFPECGLLKVATETTGLAKEGRERAALIARPYWSLRSFSIAIIIATFASIGWTIHSLGFAEFRNTQDFISFLEPAIGSAVFIGAALFFIVSLEDRFKRQRAMAALHELRSLAHVIDMHQLTKDPKIATVPNADTKSSPQRTMTPHELGRYFDYCSELLSLISKIGAIYVQEYHDPLAVNAVDSLNSMTTGLSRKIWQKMSVLHVQERELALAAPQQATTADGSKHSSKKAATDQEPKQ